MEFYKLFVCMHREKSGRVYSDWLKSFFFLKHYLWGRGLYCVAVSLVLGLFIYLVDKSKCLLHIRSCRIQSRWFSMELILINVMSPLSLPQWSAWSFLSLCIYDYRMHTLLPKMLTWTVYIIASIQVIADIIETFFFLTFVQIWPTYFCCSWLSSYLYIFGNLN